jgi:hypothetical protein
MLSTCKGGAWLLSPPHEHALETAAAVHSRHRLGSPRPVLQRRELKACFAVRAADVGVSDEWAGLLDPGEGTTRSRGRSKRPALRAKGEFSCDDVM